MRCWPRPAFKRGRSNRAASRRDADPARMASGQIRGTPRGALIAAKGVQAITS
jgi:hypothetical protein